MVSEVRNIDCMEGNAAYQRQRYDIRKNDPAFKKRKADNARASYLRNKEAVKNRCKKYRDANRGKYNEYRLNYRKNNPKGIFDVIKQSAKRRNIHFDLTVNEFCQWYMKQQRICIYCLRTEADILNQVDIIQNIAKRLSIDRLDNNKGYQINNIGLCCQRCNTIKGNFFTKDEMIEIGKIINKKYDNK